MQLKMLPNLRLTQKAHIFGCFPGVSYGFFFTLHTLTMGRPSTNLLHCIRPQLILLFNNSNEFYAAFSFILFGYMFYTTTVKEKIVQNN